MKTVLIEISLEEWPEAWEWSHNGYYIPVEKLKLYKPNFKRFGKGPEEPNPEEYIREMKKLMPKYFTKLLNQMEKEADDFEDSLSQDFFYEWMEEDLKGVLGHVMINFAMEHGLTDPLITQEFVDSQTKGTLPEMPKLDLDQVDFLKDLVFNHGLSFKVMESISHVSELEEKGESGDPAMVILNSSREFINGLVNKLQKISNWLIG